MAKRLSFAWWVGVMTLGMGCGSPAPAPTTPAPQAARPAAPPPKAAPVAPKPAPEVKVDANAYAGVPEALDAITTAIKASDNPSVSKVEAWFALRGEASVGELTAIIKDDTAELDRRLYACRVMAKTGKKGGEALLSLDVKEPELVRLRIVDTLGRIKPSSPEIVAHLKKLGFEGEVRTRQTAIASLARIGPPAKEVVPDLEKLLNDTQADEGLRKEAGKALKAIDPRKGLMGLAQ